MSDFAQRGPITTLPALAVRPLDDVEEQMSKWAVEAPTGVVIPCHANDLHSAAFENIIATLAGLPYIQEVVVGLDAATPTDFTDARQMLSVLPQRNVVVWHDGPRVTRVRDSLVAHGVKSTTHGKGQNIWYCLGYLHSEANLARVVVHDADIASYNRDFVARLVYPVLDPGLGYRVAKAFYHRETDGRLGGRLTRLLIGPLLHALSQTIGSTETLEYLKAFRYPLSGELAFDTALIADLVIPNDWGVDLAILFEFRRAVADQFICQVELHGAYDHKHRAFGPTGEDDGLLSMAHDIVRTLHHELTTQGQPVPRDGIETLNRAYLERAGDEVVRYGHVAEINGLDHDGASELNMTHRLGEVLRQASTSTLDDPPDPRPPSWADIDLASADSAPMLVEAVNADQVG